MKTQNCFKKGRFRIIETICLDPFVAWLLTDFQLTFNLCNSRLLWKTYSSQNISFPHDGLVSGEVILDKMCSIEVLFLACKKGFLLVKVKIDNWQLCLKTISFVGIFQRLCLHCKRNGLWCPGIFSTGFSFLSSFFFSSCLWQI